MLTQQQKSCWHNFCVYYPMAMKCECAAAAAICSVLKMRISNGCDWLYQATVAKQVRGTRKELEIQKYLFKLPKFHINIFSTTARNSQDII